MSLVVAKKDGSNLLIVSDTKLTERTDKNLEAKRYKDNPVDGVVKTTVVHSNLCISFAGNVDDAELAYKEIKEEKSIDVVVSILEKHHKKSNYAIEFIICTSIPDLSIYEIKNGTVTPCLNAWIGDVRAFNRFQESMLTDGKNKRNNKPITNTESSLQPGVLITDWSSTFEIGFETPLLTKMSSAMDDVIEDEVISSVGGFKVIVAFNKTFTYKGYIKNYQSNKHIVGSGAFISHGTASEGAYSINFMGESLDHQRIALHIQQGGFGIVYSRNGYGLLRPKIIKYDEVDFTDYITKQYEIITSFTTQDRVQKFFLQAKAFFSRKDYKKAEIYFDKALSEARGVEKAKVLFNKGVVLWELSDKAPSFKAFALAVNFDSSCQNRVNHFLQALIKK